MNYVQSAAASAKMTMGEQTIKCKICGQPYKVYSFYAGDQSACKTCQAIALAGESGGQPIMHYVSPAHFEQLAKKWKMR